jgi:hypothetical protein
VLVFCLDARAAHILPRLQSLLAKRRVCASISAVLLLCARNRSPGLLGGRLLLVFLESSRFGSWLDIESLGSICWVCDMLGESALFRSDGGCGRGGECRSRGRCGRYRQSRALTMLLDGGPIVTVAELEPS